MSYAIDYSSRFKKSLKKLSKDDVEKTFAVIFQLSEGKALAQKHEDHKLTGDYAGFRECHVKPDLLLIYKIEKKKLVLYCFDVGAHSTLFKK